MVNIIKAEKKHRDYMIFANKQIHNLSEQEGKTHLEQNIDTDFFCTKPKFNCLIAEKEGVPVGMLLYSKLYWADDGEVVWISQVFVNKENRRQGVFYAFMNELTEIESGCKVVAFASSKTNKIMKKVLENFGAKVVKMDFYAKSL